MDSQTFLGSYMCTETPGEFQWQPGALTQAVIRGLWVVFENIDRAPSEILSALTPLLEDGKLYIAGRGEVIQAVENLGCSQQSQVWIWLKDQVGEVATCFE